MFLKLGLFALISLTIYLGIATGLILSDHPKPTADSANEPIVFDALIAADYATIPALQPYTARDGATLYYRTYESKTDTDRVLILLHGSGWHSMQFHQLAVFVSDNGSAHVVTPDLRGHGFQPGRRGDVDYIGQLEDDLSDLIDILEKQYPNAEIILGGHSSGGGLVIRFAGSRYGSKIDAYVLLAPFIKYNAPTTRPNSGGWADPLPRRIAGLTMLNSIGVHWFDALPVIQFNMPQAVLDGPLGKSATTSYSHRLNVSFAPRNNYGRDLTAMKQPFLLVAGLDDEAFIADLYEPMITKYTDAGQYVLLPNTGHIDLLVSLQLETVLADWFITLK